MGKRGWEEFQNKSEIDYFCQGLFDRLPPIIAVHCLHESDNWGEMDQKSFLCLFLPFPYLQRIHTFGFYMLDYTTQFLIKVIGDAGGERLLATLKLNSLFLWCSLV